MIRLATIALILSLIPRPAITAGYPARVVGIVDGDMLTVLKADQTTVKIRLHGIDAPELG